jgi:hypothetical protein
MTITYTNHVETITDALRYLLDAEFNYEIVQSRYFEPERIGKGEYFRYFLSEQPVVSTFAGGETRDYIFNCSWYFNSRNYDYKKTFDDIISDRIERLKRLLFNNKYYSPSNVYKWHHLQVGIAEIFYLGEEDPELEKYSHVLCTPIIITITRSDINQ